MDHKSIKGLLKELDLFSTIVPFLCICALCVMFVEFPEKSSATLESIRYFLGDQLGSYYLLLGLGVFLCSLYLAFSRFGKIRLGNTPKPEYSDFKWASMMFTTGMAADVVFYACCEWVLYWNESHLAGMNQRAEWAATFPLFHWGPVPWSFYLVLAVAFGFMLHVRKRNKQKFSESCRPLLGRHVDGWIGKLIDLIAIFALLAGTATSFSVATPLLSMAISRVTGIAQSVTLTIIILLIVCFIYTYAVYFGMSAIMKVAALCTYLFFTLLIYVFVFGGQSRFIVETGITSLGLLTQNYIAMSTWTDSLRATLFPQTWTIFYWALWMVWCVAVPFFIGSISKGRTIKQVILGGYGFGLAGTFVAFIVLGNYGLGMQVHGMLDVITPYVQSGDLYAAIITIIEQLPLSKFVLVLLVTCMVMFFSTSFDSITLVASTYSYKTMKEGQEPDRRVKLFWAIFLILLPLALIFSKNSLENLKTVTVIAAFPLGIIIILIIWSFFKDASLYLKETDNR